MLDTDGRNESNHFQIFVFVWMKKWRCYHHVLKIDEDNLYPTLTLHWYHYSWPRVVWSKPPPSPCTPGSPPAPAGCRPRAPGPIRGEHLVTWPHVNQSQLTLLRFLLCITVITSTRNPATIRALNTIEPQVLSAIALLSLYCRYAYAVLYNVTCEGAAGGLNVLART